MKQNRFNGNELYFIEYLTKITNKEAQYLNLPTEVSFNTLLNESIDHCIKKRTINRTRESLIFTDFYEYIKDDKILKKIDESEYYNLLEKLTKANNNTIKIEELENYLKKIRFLFSKRYLNKTIIELKNILKKENINFHLLEELTMIFVNEMLVERATYPFLNALISNAFVDDSLFDNIEKIIDYIAYEEYENIEMYLPIKNYTERDLEFLENQGQQMERMKSNTGKNKVFCKVFANGIDYFNMCNEHMIRIESYFNLFKFYRESKISFDYNEDVFVKRTKKLNDSFYIKFSELISYRYFIGSKKIIESTILNVSKLKDIDNSLFYSINNILSYAEKDNDILSVSSFVDNWIALENIIKLSGFRNGFEGVIEYIPKVLDIQYYRKALNESLNKTDEKRKSLTLDSFIDKVYSDELNFLSQFKYSNKIFIEREIENVTNFVSMEKKLLAIRKYLVRDLRRIYELRNEYVHSSNIKAHRGVLPYKLKRIFSDFFDAFMKTLNSHLKNEHYKVDGVDIISDLIKKYDNRSIVLKIYSGRYKVNGENVNKKQIESDIETKEVFRNLIFERIKILNIDPRDDD